MLHHGPKFSPNQIIVIIPFSQLSLQRPALHRHTLVDYSATVLLTCFQIKQAITDFLDQPGTVKQSLNTALAYDHHALD